MLIKEDKAIQKFLQNLPGVSVTDSQSYRIEALRVYLEENLGDEIFITAYTVLITNKIKSLKIII